MNFVQTLTAVEKSRALSCAIRFLLAAILSGSQIFGAYAPFGLGFVAAAGAGMEGLSALLGLLVGASDPDSAAVGEAGPGRAPGCRRNTPAVPAQGKAL